MSVFDRDVLAERAMTIERHLQRVAARLPPSGDELCPTSDASDVVILHLWQATQLVIDLAMAACLELKLGTPASDGDAFRKLEQTGLIGEPLTSRLEIPVTLAAVQVSVDGQDGYRS